MEDDVNGSLGKREGSHLFPGYLLGPNVTNDPRDTAPTLMSVDVVKGVCLVVISVLGASFNAFMIVAIVPNRRLRTVRNILLVHLGGVGLMSSVFTTMYAALIAFHGEWLGGHPMCLMYAYLTCVFTSVSVWTIAALSWDKYQTIASPLHHSLTATLRKMLPCFLVFWVCGIVLSLPPLFGASQYDLHATMGICIVKSTDDTGTWYACVLVCLSFIFPFFLMIYCYAHIFRIARTQSSRIAATMLRMVSVMQAPIAPSTQTSLSLRGTKAMGTILQLIGSFVLTYLPYAIMILYEVIFKEPPNAVVVSIATTLFLAAPFTHAAIYGIRNQILRTSFYRYSRRKIHNFCAKDKRRGSVKSLTRKSPTALKIPMKCIVKCDGKQYILRRTLSCQGSNLNGEINNVSDHVTSLPRPHSFNVLREALDDWTPPMSNGSRRHNSGAAKEQVKEVSFSDVDEVSYIQPDGVSHVARQEMSFYSKDIMKEMSAMDSEMEEISRYDNHEELSEFLKPSREASTSDSRRDDVSSLKQFREKISRLDSKKPPRVKGSNFKDKSKLRHPAEKSGRQRQTIDHEESSIFHVGEVDEESSFDLESDERVSFA